MYTKIVLSKLYQSESKLASKYKAAIYKYFPYKPHQNITKLCNTFNYVTNWYLNLISNWIQMPSLYYLR